MEKFVKLFTKLELFPLTFLYRPNFRNVSQNAIKITESLPKDNKCPFRYIYYKDKWTASEARSYKTQDSQH